MPLSARAPLLLAALLGTGWALVFSAVPAEAGKPHAKTPIPDRVVPGHTHLREGNGDRRGMALRSREVRSSAYGGRIRASNGEYVRVVMSNAYAPDSGVLQAFANLTARLQHGSELSLVTVLVAPQSEVTTICETPADGCYDYSHSTIAVTGDDPNPTYTGLVLAHEYGHFLADHRRNDPWNSLNRGPKYWSTYENVCHRVLTGTAFIDYPQPYGLRAGEAFAESFATLNGYGYETGLLDASFKPDAGALGAISKDVHHPSKGNIRYRRRGRFRHGQRSRVVRLRRPHDGRVDVRLRARGADDLVLYTEVAGRKQMLIHAHPRGSRTHLRFTICGDTGPLRLKVIRRRGPGWYRMRISQP